MPDFIENIIDSKSMNVTPTYSLLGPAIGSENGVVITVLKKIK